MTPPFEGILRTMRLLHYFSSAFIDFFGITQPSPNEEERASWLITILAASILALVVGVLLLLLHLLRT